MTIVYDYKKDGTLKITETYSGEKLKSKFKEDKLTGSQTLSIPDGKWVAEDGMADSKYRLSGGHHLRFWGLPGGDIVSNGHHDDNVLTIPGPQVNGYENAEVKVAGFFGTVYETYWLNNEFYNSYYNAYNDGTATLV